MVDGERLLAEQALRHVALLRPLPENVRELVLASLEPVSYEFGDVVVAEGSPADALYVITSGTARVVKGGAEGDEVPLAVLRPGDFFGEDGLLEGGTRTATVRARSRLTALRLDDSIVRALASTNPEVRDALAVSLKAHRLRSFLRLDSDLADIPSEALRLLVDEVEPLEVEDGAVIIRQGERAAGVYVVEEGRVRLWRADSGRRTDVAFLRRGDFFGGSWAQAETPVTAEAASRSKLLLIPASELERVGDAHPRLRARVEHELAEYAAHAVTRVLPLDFADTAPPRPSPTHASVSLDRTDFSDDEIDVADEDQPPLSRDPRFSEPRPRIRRFPHVFQIDEADCGAACLAMICRHFGHAVSLAHIRRVVHTTTDGSSLMGIARGAEELGLAARTVKASKTRLERLPLPAVVHWQGNHWVVLYRVDERTVRLVDPALGPRRLKRTEFEAAWSGYAALVAFTPALERAPKATRNIRWLWPFLRPHRGTLVKALLLALVAAGLQLALPIFSQIVVDRVIRHRNFALLHVAALAMLGVLLLMVGFSVAQRFILSRAAVRIDASTLDFLTGKLLALPMSYFGARRTGDIEQRLSGMRHVRQFVIQNGVLALTAVTQLAASIALMLVYDWVLALVYLGALPVYVGLLRYAARWLRPLFDGLEEALGEYQSRQIDAIKGIEAVKTMAAEQALRARLLEQFLGLAHRVFRADLSVMLYRAAVQLVTLLSLALFLWFGGLRVLHGDLTIGELIAFNALVLLANAPISMLLSLWDELQLSDVLLNRLNDIFDQEPEQGRDRSHLRPVPTLSGEVRAMNVGFRYGGPASTPILEEVDFDVEPGTTVAIVGRSGSGKTTLAKCLVGLLEPTEGSILYDGIDLGTLDYRDLRKHVGFVLQESYLFDDTIAGNIAFGHEQPDMERVLWAARAANAEEFVERLPLGYETRVGESGLALSGGQRQRIAIARALYDRPPVLILDEATSSLDSESERALKESMDDLLEGRTSFVIAHRLSTIRDADVIFVLERGRIVERGTHEELMAREGLYTYLCGQQLEL